MAFWGVFVQPGQPYTLKFDGDKKRLRISQATLGERSFGIWTSRSSLKCCVGSKPPVLICSVSKELPCCRLDLEFEESEDVVFSIKGPRGIHLSGYYVMPHAAENATATRTDDLRMYPYSNCNGKDQTSNAENDKDRRLEEEDIGKTNSPTVGGEEHCCDNNDGGNDAFIDAADILINSVLQELNACADKNTEEISCSTDGSVEGEVEHVVCARKSDKTAMDMIEEDGENADNITCQPKNTLDSDTDGIGSKEKADSVNRLGKHESEQQIREIIEVCGEPRTLNADIGQTRNIDLEGDKALEAGSASNDMCQEGARNQRSQESSVNMEIGVSPSMLLKHEVCSEVGQKSKKRRRKNDNLKDLPGREGENRINDKLPSAVSKETDCLNNTDQSSDVCNENRRKTKKRKKPKVSKREDGASFDHFQENIEQSGAIDGNIVQILPENSKEGKPACDNEEQIREIIEGCEEPRTLNADIGQTRNIDLEGNKALEAGSASNDMCQEGARNHQSQESSVNVEIGVPPSMLLKHEVYSEVGQKSKKRRRKDDNLKDLPRREGEKTINDRLPSAVSKETDSPKNIDQSSFSNENRRKTKKRKKPKVSKRESLKEDGASFDHFQEYFKQSGATDGNVVQVLPENSKEGKPACDKGNDIYSRKKKKKQKIKGDKNEENLYSKSSRMRTLSNDLIIQELKAGTSGGEVAAPGKKVKVFYTARIMDTGSIVDSNVGQAPFRFCVGDERVVKGWNIGVDGMRIGEKRRLTIPPSMGYGKRFLEIIPPNSWLVCDIELVGVR